MCTHVKSSYSHSSLPENHIGKSNLHTIQCFWHELQTKRQAQFMNIFTQHETLPSLQKVARNCSQGSACKEWESIPIDRIAHLTHLHPFQAPVVLLVHQLNSCLNRAHATAAYALGISSLCYCNALYISCF